jgi:hypothetical protein
VKEEQHRVIVISALDKHPVLGAVDFNMNFLGDAAR